MTNRSIPTTTLGDSPKQLIGKTPIALVHRGVARTVKLDLIPNLEENWSFSPGPAEHQLRFDAPKTQTVILELGLLVPRC